MVEHGQNGRRAAVVLVVALALAGCGGGGTTTAAGGHGAGHSTDGGAPGEAPRGNDADVAFLAGMTPHHEQAVEMSDLVLAADPPADVAALARQVKDAQAPEVEQMEQMLADLGAGASGGHSGHGSHSAHGGMMSEAELAALDAATGTDAARLYLEAMIEHHEGAVEAARTQVADGQYAPAVALAQQIERAQTAEITRMRELLAAL